MPLNRQPLTTRPYHVLWHGKFLRSFTTLHEAQTNKQFFDSFLLEITILSLD